MASTAHSNADATIKVRFRSPEQGGRAQPAGGHWYGCPMVIRGEGFDCRLLLDGKTLEPERWYEVPVKFLSREQADTVLAVGQAITLWEGKTIAEGFITGIDPVPAATRREPAPQM